MTKLLPVILCGGSGTRLWPLSDSARPKQFLNLLDDRSLLQNTAQRLLNVTGANPSDILSVTSEKLAPLVYQHLTALSPELGQHIICETSGRNTAPAIWLALQYIIERWQDDPLLLVCPSDAYMGDEDAFSQALVQAIPAAEQGKIAIFGVSPQRPETGFGYIRHGEAFSNSVFHVEHFTEKPCLEDAQNFLLSGDYLWNSGIFLFKMSTVLKEYQLHAPKFFEIPEFNDLPSLPFDKAILEKSSNIVVVPMDPEWSDLGSWESLWQIAVKDDHGNAVTGNAILSDCANCLIKAGQSKKLALSGLEDTVVIEMDELIYIGNISDPSAPSKILKKLQ